MLLQEARIAQPEVQEPGPSRTAPDIDPARRGVHVTIFDGFHNDDVIKEKINEALSSRERPGAILNISPPRRARKTHVVVEMASRELAEQVVNKLNGTKHKKTPLKLKLAKERFSVREPSPADSAAPVERATTSTLPLRPAPPILTYSNLPIASTNATSMGARMEMEANLEGKGKSVIRNPQPDSNVQQETQTEQEEYFSEDHDDQSDKEPEEPVDTRPSKATSSSKGASSHTSTSSHRHDHHHREGRRHH